MPAIKIATFNINGIRSRIGALRHWLEREAPDVACLQELKTADDGFPARELREAGYGAIWHGQKSWNGVAILARGAEPVEVRRGLPGDPDDSHSRYLEAAVHGILVGCLYLPNGNPQPGPKFDYKLAWFARLIEHAQTLFDSGHPVVLAGDYNVARPARNPDQAGRLSQGSGTTDPVGDHQAWPSAVVPHDRGRDRLPRMATKGLSDPHGSVWVQP